MDETGNGRTMDIHAYNIQVRALIYKESGLFYARSLEMDLVGTGATAKKALARLKKLVEEHVAFAVFKNDANLVLFKAEKQYFDRWEQAVTAQLRNELFPDAAVQLKYMARGFVITKQDVAKMKKKAHSNAPLELACA
jgi:hypothetical protein